MGHYHKMISPPPSDFRLEGGNINACLQGSLQKITQRKMKRSFYPDPKLTSRDLGMHFVVDPRV